MMDNIETNTDFRKIPIYRHSAEYAVKHNEIEVYRKSNQASMACCKAIENAINNNYRNNSLDTKTASVQLGQKFGLERVSYILANTIRFKNHDGRISAANKTWAASFPIAEDKSEWGDDRNRVLIVDRAHAGLVDLLTNQVREDLEQEKASKERKPSVLEKIMKPAAGESSALKSEKPGGREEIL